MYFTREIRKRVEGAMLHTRPYLFFGVNYFVF